jgi:hypothetical protein
MKILLCAQCLGAVAIPTKSRRARSCRCGRTWGRRVRSGEHPIEYGGPCVVLGFDDATLAQAVTAQCRTGKSTPIRGALIQPTASTLIRRRRRGG